MKQNSELQLAKADGTPVKLKGLRFLRKIKFGVFFKRGFNCRHGFLSVYRKSGNLFAGLATFKV
jgi:hypothetical protein